MRESGWSAQVVAVEQSGRERAFVSLDDLERLAGEDPTALGTILSQLRVVFESWHDRSGGLYVQKQAS